MIGPNFVFDKEACGLFVACRDMSDEDWSSNASGLDDDDDDEGNDFDEDDSGDGTRA